MSLLDDFKQFVADAEAGAQYAAWARDNPVDLGRWHGFRDAILAGARPSRPTMSSPHGRELIDAGVQYLDATAGSPPPPSQGWVVAPPAPPPAGTVIDNPVGAGVNIHVAKATVTDTVVNAGQDQAFLIQGGQAGGAGSTLQRIQGNAVGGYSSPGNNKHFLYCKAANVTVLDALASAALSPHRGDGGLSVRYAGFHAERFKLTGFQLPLCIFADDEKPGLVLFKNGIVDTQPGEAVFYGSTDEAAKLVYDVELDNIQATGPVGVPFWSFDTGTFEGTLKVHATCTYNGVPITKASQGQKCPVGQLLLVP